MASVAAYPPIVETPDGARLERLPRVRVVQIVMDQVAHGWSAEEILRQYPQLLAAEVHAALAYYFDHREAMDEEIREEWTRADREAVTPPPPALAAKLRPPR